MCVGAAIVLIILAQARPSTVGSARWRRGKGRAGHVLRAPRGIRYNLFRPSNHTILHLAGGI